MQQQKERTKMKITRISVEFMLDEGTAVEDFMARLLSTTAPVTIEHHQPATQIAEANAAAETAQLIENNRRRRSAAEVQDEPPAETGSRRRRSAAPAPAASEPAQADAPAAETTSRRRRTPAPEAAPAAPAAPAGISDADMSKAASNTADVLVNMGEDGPGIVKLILQEMEVASVADLPQDQRQKFLDECAKEIRLAKEEKEMAS